jgi:hypothetical protein
MTTADTIVTLIFGIMLGWAGLKVRDLWITRRQPVRMDAPTGTEPWMQTFWRK